MARGRRRAPRRVNPWFIAIPLLFAGAGVALLFVLRGGEGSGRPKPKPTPQPPFAFAAASVQFVPLQKRDAVPENPGEVAAAVTGVMSDVYDAGFVSSKRWEKGRFSAVLTHFDEKARAQAEADLSQLTLGPEAARLGSVEPGTSSLELSFLVDKREAMAAVAETSFTGTGKLRKGGSISITHGGTYYLELLEGEWRIVGYRVNGSLDSVAPTPVPTAGATP